MQQFEKDAISVEMLVAMKVEWSANKLVAHEVEEKVDSKDVLKASLKVLMSAAKTGISKDETRAMLTAALKVQKKDGNWVEGMDWKWEEKKD